MRCRMYACHQPAEEGGRLCAAHRAELEEQAKQKYRFTICIWPECRMTTTGLYCEEHRRLRRRASWRRSKEKARAQQEM